MSLDINLKCEKRCKNCGEHQEYFFVGDFNITHNLAKMADKAGIYEALWRPYKLHPDWKPISDDDYNLEIGFEANHPMYVKDILVKLKNGLEDLKARPDYFKQFDASNGWGTYEHFVPFVQEVYDLYKQYPEGELQVSR